MERKAVLFDLDDTLFPEIEYVKSGFRAAAEMTQRRLGTDAKTVYARFWDIMKTQGRGKVFDCWLDETGNATEMTVEEMVREYRGHIPLISLYPDVAPNLLNLRSSGFVIGIITDGDLTAQMRKVEALALKSMVDTVVFTDERGIEYWKPNPAVFEDTLRSLDVKPGCSVYVGNDPKKDFTGPRVIGMHTIHLQRGASREHTCDAEHHMSGLDDLGDWADQHLGVR